MITTAAQVRPGQHVIFTPFNDTVNCEVAGVTQVGVAMGTDVPILRFTFVDPPRPLKAWEIPANREVCVV